MVRETILYGLGVIGVLQSVGVGADLQVGERRGFLITGLASEVHTLVLYLAVTALLMESIFLPLVQAV